MQRFDILDPDLDVFESRFLEASAGTGKTFAIEHLIVRLMEKIPLANILAVTFTREAAHEMKTRVRSQLKIPADDLQIYTIHGFCHKMLTEFAFEGKMPLQLASPEKPNHVVEMEQLVEDFLRTGGDEFSFEVGHLLKRMRFDLERLKSRIIALLEKGEEPTPFKLEIPNLSFEHLKEEFEVLAPRYKRLKAEEFAPQVEKFATLAESGAPLKLLEEKEWFFERMHEENAKVRATPLSSISLKNKRVIEHLHKTLTPPLKIARDPNECLKRLALECRKRWEVKREKTETLSFDDLLVKMREALKQAPFREKVRAKYQAVIVDEFQDTDPIQWEIFEQLFLDEHLLYLVGDPKQSIYGFRNADIYTYMRAADALGPEKKAHLDTNFRSSPQLIAELNRIFTKHPSWIELPSLPGALQYHPVKAGRGEGLLSEIPIQGYRAKSEERAFSYIASEILRQHQENEVPFDEVAILVKDRFEGQRLAAHLNLWKIASELKRTLSLVETRGFARLEVLLKSGEHAEEIDEKGFAAFFKEYIGSEFEGDSALYLEMRSVAEILMQTKGATHSELLHLLEELKQSNPEKDERLKIQGEGGASKVAILTTFASKGLEYTIVFAHGLATSHPKDEKNVEKDAEKMRQLYVAFTRPKEKLYVPLPPTFNGNSPIDLFFALWEEIDLPIAEVKEIPITPYVEEGRKELTLDSRPRNFAFEIETLTSFTAMAKPSAHVILRERFHAQDLSIKTAHTLPLGSETGTVIHSVFENLFETRSAPIEQTVCETLMGTHLEGWEEVIADMAGEVLGLPLLKNFTLEALAPGDYMQEMEFLYPKGSQLIKGFADLVFRLDDQFYLLDWKTNWLGPSGDAYTEEAMDLSMREHDYYLQAELYAEALRRYVKPLYPSAEFGGAFYVFVRGKKGVHFGIS